MSTAEEKVPGGKLVRVSVARDGRVQITGDFFVHPEESITLIEDALSSLEGTEPAEEIERVLNNLIIDGGLELIGVDVRVIARLYRGCLI